MIIREIAISHYGPLRDVRLGPGPGLQVYYGPNESGKTLLIDGLLKLLLGKNLRDFANIDRVAGLPQGRVALAHQGKESILDGRVLLPAVTGVNSADLRNIFVIRNKDLQISDQADYFSRLNDQLTGMDGRRLLRLKEILRTLGRMTNASSGARLSKAQEFDAIGEKVASADLLAQEIREYLDRAREGKLDALEKRLEETRRRQQETGRRILDLEAAENWERYRQLKDQVEEYDRRSQAASRLLPYTKTKFMQLQDKASRSRANLDSAAESREKLARLLPQLEGAAAKLADLEVELASQEGRKLFLDNLGQQIMSAAQATSPPPPPLWFRFSLACLGLTALALFLASLQALPANLKNLPYWSLGAGALLFLVDLALRLRGLGSRKRQALLLQQGAAAGLMAKTLQELAVTAAKEKEEIDQARARLQQQGEKLRSLESQKLYLEENIRATAILAAELEREVERELQRVEAADLNQFAELMEQYSRAQAQCDDLHQSLETAFEQAPVRTGDWFSLLRQLPAPPDPGLASDPAALARLRGQREELEEEIDELRQELNRHQGELNRFAGACQALPLEKETGCRLPPQFADLELLAHSASVLELFVAKVNEDLENALALTALLETLEGEEQEKMSDLVGPTKPVQAIFREVTGDRYTRVKLDGKLNILVENRDGLELPAMALSQGTFDQLYLALRLSLAQDRLEGDPGFLILDDAYLCADSVRLERMLALLARLAEEGWQILYFTMDERLLRSPHTAGAITHLEPLLPDFPPV